MAHERTRDLLARLIGTLTSTADGESLPDLSDPERESSCGGPWLANDPVHSDGRSAQLTTAVHLGLSGALVRHTAQVPQLRIAQDAAADELLSRDPLALLLGMLLDQHMLQRSTDARR
jgi:hypothetical protein